MKEKLSPAIEAFTRFRASQSYSKATMRADGQVLSRFLSVNGNIWCHVITDRHVERHFEEASKSRGAASLQLDTNTLRMFFKWARHTGRMPVDCDPMFGRRSPRVTKRERNRVTVHQFPELLAAAEERTPRDRALVALLLYTLCRDTEITSLRVRDVDLEGGWLRVRVFKTHQEDTMPISEELDTELRKWLTHYTKQCGPLQPHWFLTPARGVFPVHDPETKRIVRHESHYRPERGISGAGRVVSPVLERMGFPVVDAQGKACGEGAHTIRRSGARALFDKLVGEGYDGAIRLVQSMLHHASLTQTERYIGITADRRSRDDVIRGKKMYNESTTENVVSIAR